MSKQALKYRTQWSSQFFVAAELTRRGYLVSLTLGNAPTSDLLVQSPNGNQFTVDVKGQSNKSFWLIQNRPHKPDHFFVLVYVPKDLADPRYFVVPSDELMRRREEYKQASIERSLTRKRGQYRDDLGGINWSTAYDYEDQWDCLPE